MRRILYLIVGIGAFQNFFDDKPSLGAGRYSPFVESAHLGSARKGLNLGYAIINGSRSRLDLPKVAAPGIVGTDVGKLHGFTGIYLLLDEPSDLVQLRFAVSRGFSKIRFEGVNVGH